MDSGVLQDRHALKRIDPREPPSLIATQGSAQETNFFRSCSLCANGAVALTASEDRMIEVYSLPGLLGSTQTTCFRMCKKQVFTIACSLPSLRVMAIAPARRFLQSGSVLGTLWYPTAVPENPSAFCFLASVRECPVKLLDASDGRLRASYKIVDHRERQIAPYSMVFNHTVSKLYCGFRGAIEVFDINYPGEGERIFTTPSKKSKSGLKGIISALAFCPDYSGLYAAGTFSSSLVLYAESTQAEIVQSLGGVDGPVTQIKFNPMQPHIVYATSRQSDCILGWDIRGDTSIPLQAFERPGLTNQRLSFDLDVYGTTMVTGDKDGFISCFDLGTETPEKPSLKYKAHDDAVAATALHPFEPALVSVSGSRHYDNNLFETETDSSDFKTSFDDAIRIRSRRSQPVSRDTSIKLWAFPFRDANYQWENHLSMGNEQGKE